MQTKSRGGKVGFKNIVPSKKMVSKICVSAAKFLSALARQSSDFVCLGGTD